MAEHWLLTSPGSLSPGAAVELEGAEARHATAVLRLRSGAPVVLADGQGTTARASLRVLGRGRAVAEVGSVDTAPAPASAGVDVALALLHGRTMDWAVQKAVEIGVRRFLPLITARSQPPRAAARGRLAHWREAARQALKQCHRPWGMHVSDPVSLVDLVAERSESGGVVADPRGRRPSSLPLGHPRFLLVGPEGGLTSEEQGLLDSDRWLRLWLGPHVLRSETAAIVGAGILEVMG